MHTMGNRLRIWRGLVLIACYHVASPIWSVASQFACKAVGRFPPETHLSSTIYYPLGEQRSYPKAGGTTSTTATPTAAVREYEMDDPLLSHSASETEKGGGGHVTFIGKIFDSPLYEMKNKKKKGPGRGG